MHIIKPVYVHVRRLSNFEDAALRNNNPHTAHHSDTRRPSKPGEELTQMYDNQWTKAFLELEKRNMDEQDVINNLLAILEVVRGFNMHVYGVQLN